MSGELTISGGGSIAVATDELIERAQQLEDLRDATRSIAEILRAADLIVSPQLLRAANAPVSALDAESDIATAIGLLDRASGRAGHIASGIRISSNTYGLAERVRESALQELASTVGWALGRAMPILVIGSLPFVVAGGTGFIIGAGGPDKALGIAQGWLADNNEVLTNPAVVELIRLASGSLDDLLAGFVGLPPGVSQTIGDQGTGLTGPETAAAILTLAGVGIGLFGEHGVSVTTASTTSGEAAPTGFADRVSRIPVSDSNGGSQIRVDRYHRDGQADSYEVYIAGTADFSVKGTTTPFDMGSNMRGMSGLPAGSEAAIRKALVDAGVTKDSPITFTGHSQGGLMAHLLASSGDYNTKAVFEVGAPASQVPLPHGIDGVSIAHTDDLVPALGGQRPNDDMIMVERQAFTGAIPPGEPVPAHSRERYFESAELLDGVASDKVDHAKEVMNDLAEGATITSTLYTAVRDD